MKNDTKKRLMPGDILHVQMQKPKTLFDKAFSSATQAVQGSMTHTAMYIGNGKIIEARIGEGVKVKSMAKALRGESYIALRPKTSIRKRLKAVEFAKKQLGKGYDETVLVMSGLRKVLPEFIMNKIDSGKLSIPKNAQAFTCSNLIAAAYKKNGIDLGDMRVAPTDLRVNPKLNIVMKKLKKGFKETIPLLPSTGNRLRYRQQYRDRRDR